MKRAIILTIAIVLSLVLSAGSAGSLFDLAIPAAPSPAEEPAPPPEPESPSAAGYRAEGLHPVRRRLPQVPGG